MHLRVAEVIYYSLKNIFGRSSPLAGALRLPVPLVTALHPQCCRTCSEADGGFGIGSGSPSDWTACMNAYGFATELEALNYCGNPVNNMQPLAQAGIPLLHVVGDADDVVPLAENTAVVEARYITFDGAIKVIHKPGVGHVHGLDDPSPIINFIMNTVYAEDHVPMFVPGIAISNGSFNVQFTGTTGQHYRVETVDDLTTTNA